MLWPLARSRLAAACPAAPEPTMATSAVTASGASEAQSIRIHPPLPHPRGSLRLHSKGRPCQRTVRNLWRDGGKRCFDVTFLSLADAVRLSSILEDYRDSQ